MLAAFVIALTSYAIVDAMRSAVLAILAALLLISAAAPFLFRTHYRIDDAGIRERRGLVTRSRAWCELRRLEIGTRAALVSPYAKARWLDRYRGITLYLDGSDRAAVIRELRAHLAG